MQFKIHSEGWSFLIVSLIFTFVFLPFLPLLGILFLFISIFIFYFFRDPIRSIPLDDLILSPADGIITYIGMENPPLEFNQHNQFKK